MRSRAYDNLIKPAEGKKPERLDTKILDTNLRRTLLYLKPYRFVYDGKDWLAYSYYNICIDNLPALLLTSYMDAVKQVAKKALRHAYSPEMKEQVRKWTKERMNLNDPKLKSVLKIRDNEKIKLNLARFKQYPIIDCSENHVAGTTRVSPMDIFRKKA